MKTTFVKSLLNGVKKHSPGILTGLGIVGMVTAAVLAVKATPKAIDILEEEKKKAETDELPLKETVKATWKCYIPAGVTGGVSILCILGASKIHIARNAALTAAYSMSEMFAKEYRDKTREIVGEKKEQEIRDEVAKDMVRKKVAEEDYVAPPKRGPTRCYDPYTDKVFWSSMEEVKKAINVLNHRLNSEMYVNLNDFYYEIGRNPTKPGRILGWCVEKGLVEPSFSSILDDDGQPCLVVDFRNPPYYNYC